MRETLDVWPELPIIVNIWNDSRLIYPEDEGNIIAALEDHNRLCQISLSGLSTPLLGRLAPMMQGPFPKLTSLHLGSDGDIAEVPSDAFSNGFAPRLQRLWLIDISFQKLPDLLSSTPDLTELYLVGIPSSGYISPEVMTKCLSKLARLNCLRLEFHSPNPRPVRGIQGPPPLTRTTLPALTVFIFRGVSEYLDVLVAQIDAPRLENLYITFFNQLIFTIPHLQQFVGRTGNLQSPNRAAVLIDSAFVEIILYQPGTTPRSLTLRISCGKSDWQISSLVQVCGPFLPSLSSVEELEIRHFHYYRADWPADVDDDQWLEFFHPFTVVQILYVRRTVGPAVALALRNLTGERATEVLPALRDIFVEGRQPYSPMCAAMESFLTARRLSDHSDYPAL